MEYDEKIDREADTIVVVAVDGRYAGYILISDEIKEDAGQTIEELKKLGIRSVMLSGDKQSVVEKLSLIHI